MSLRPLEFVHNVEQVPAADVDFAGVYREWKVLEVRQRSN